MFKNNMRKRSLFFLLGVLFILSSLNVSGFLNFAEEISDIGTYQTYKHDNRRTGSYTTNLGNEFIDNFAERCSLGSEGTNHTTPVIVTDLEGDGDNEFVIFTPNQIKIYNGSCSLID